jgi:hypothetical protein
MVPPVFILMISKAVDRSGQKNARLWLILSEAKFDRICQSGLIGCGSNSAMNCQIYETAKQEVLMSNLLP